MLDTNRAENEDEIHRQIHALNQQIPKSNLSGGEVLLQLFRKKAQYKKHSLVYRLRDRQLGKRLPRANFYQNLPLNGSVGRAYVDSQECFLSELFDFITLFQLKTS